MAVVLKIDAAAISFVSRSASGDCHLIHNQITAVVDMNRSCSVIAGTAGDEAAFSDVLFYGLGVFAD